MTSTDSDYLRNAREVSRLVLALAERLQQGFAACAGESGLSAAQAKVLLRLRSDEALPMRTLARSLGYDASNLTGLVDKLEARGAVERRLDPSDRRIKAIAMTEEGARLREGFQRRLESAAGPLASLSDSQMRELRDTLKTLLD